MNIALTDVVILHDIVALAQHDLDIAPSPKPLPAAALFKAYDEVLPQYGIDPDNDHHLSTFIFRIGGEEGHAPLLDKFQAILEHLGITVELGEDLDQEVHDEYDAADVQASPAPSTTRSVRSIFNRALTFHPRVNPERAISSRQALARVPELGGPSHEQTEESSLASPAAITTGRHVVRNNMDWLADDLASNNDTKYIDPERPQLSAKNETPSREHERGPPPQLESDLNRWIRAAKAQRDNIFTSPARTVGTSAPSAMDATTPERPIESRQSQVPQYLRDQLARPANPSPPSLLSLIDGWRGAALQHLHQADSLLSTRAGTSAGRRLESDTSAGHQQVEEAEEQGQSMVDTAGGKAQPQHEAQNEPLDHFSATRQAAATAVLSKAKHVDAQRGSLDASLSHEEIATMQIQQQKLLYRASRARQLYLASKFFNHWADRTARRLEREGVARRHMIRFRCFRGWTHMPNSRDPAVDRLQLVAAFQKLRRAMLDTQEVLEDRTACGIQLHNRKAVIHALTIWRRNVTVRDAQRRAAERIKTRTALCWQMQTATNAAALEVARLRSQQTREASSLRRWHEQADDHRVQTTAARDIGDANLGLTHLRSWWDKSETSRRANVYYNYLYSEKAAHAFSEWNLAARSQAFKWNHDYRTASQVFDRWDVLAQDDRETGVAAQSHYDRRVAARALCGLEKARLDQRRTNRVQGRVRLFLTATKTLKVFDEVVKRRRTEEKERVKKRLMSKYKQASSARKRRQFFTALSRWQQCVNTSRACAQLASETCASREGRKRIDALDAWSECTKLHNEGIDHAVQHYVASWRDHWSTFAEEGSQQDTRAWEAWSLDRQHAALKDWSILSLQRGGQAHTASVAYQKYIRDRRRRALQLWKHRREKANGAEDVEPPLSFTPAPASLRSYRQSWRFFSDRGRGLGNRSSVMSSTDTPTRSTGQISLMSSTMGQNPMPAVQEADENDHSKSSARGEKGFVSPVRSRQDDNVFAALASTTPLVPVPSYLQQDRESMTKPIAWPKSAFQQRSQYVPSNLGNTQPQRIFPRSVQERSSDGSSGGRATDSGSSLFRSKQPWLEVDGDRAMQASPLPATLAATPRQSRLTRAFNRNSPRLQAMDIDDAPRT